MSGSGNEPNNSHGSQVQAQTRPAVFKGADDKARTTVDIQLNGDARYLDRQTWARLALIYKLNPVSMTINGQPLCKDMCHGGRIKLPPVSNDKEEEYSLAGSELLTLHVQVCDPLTNLPYVTSVTLDRQVQDRFRLNLTQLTHTFKFRHLQPETIRLNGYSVGDIEVGDPHGSQFTHQDVLDTINLSNGNTGVFSDMPVLVEGDPACLLFYHKGTKQVVRQVLEKDGSLNFTELGEKCDPPVLPRSIKINNQSVHMNMIYWSLCCPCNPCGPCNVYSKPNMMEDLEAGLKPHHLNVVEGDPVGNSKWGLPRSSWLTILPITVATLGGVGTILGGLAVKYPGNGWAIANAVLAFMVLLVSAVLAALKGENINITPEMLDPMGAHKAAEGDGKAASSTEPDAAKKLDEIGAVANIIIAGGSSGNSGASAEADGTKPTIPAGAQPQGSTSGQGGKLMKPTYDTVSMSALQFASQSPAAQLAMIRQQLGPCSYNRYTRVEHKKGGVI